MREFKDGGVLLLYMAEGRKDQNKGNTQEKKAIWCLVCSANTELFL